MSHEGHHLLVEPILYQSPARLFERFAHTPWNMLIDSSDGAQQSHGTNRYSYILVDPFERYSFESKCQHNDSLNVLREKAARYYLPSRGDLPPFQGGLAGYLSYDWPLNEYAIKYDSVCPELAFGFYDMVCSFDHLNQTAYLISSGFPEHIPALREQRAIQRLDWLKRQLDKPSIIMPTKSIRINDLSSNFTEAEYKLAVKKTIDYILAGDVFQVNLAQRFFSQLPDVMYRDDYDLYQRLTQINPAPFAAFLNFGGYKIISASPERFIKLHDKQVETRPIKGTRPRHKNPIEDALAKAQLLASEKDCAENTMIVDLMRNDLSKVCEDDSVRVKILCGHEQYPTVHHLVSVIEGRLNDKADAFSLLQACFPGGSITGAPKIRAMQLIAELEPHSRGPYCGSIVLIGFDGNMDSSILIRSYVIKNNYLTFHAGGGIVLDSNPSDEYEETLIKASALKKALNVTAIAFK